MSTPSGLGMVLVISGPSGVGKDTVWNAAAPCIPSFKRAITCTTRERRPGEEEGVNYYYVTNEKFDHLIATDELIEHAEVHGNRYGVPQWSIFKRINEGLDVVCVIDVQGAVKIRARFPMAVLIFIKPPAGRESEVLEQRIQGRNAVDALELATRLQTASWELSQTHLYDHEIVNDDLQRAARELCAVVAAEKARQAHPQ